MKWICFFFFFFFFFFPPLTSAKWAKNAMDWMVLPNPISSASIPLIPYDSMKAKNVKKENKRKKNETENKYEKFFKKEKKFKYSLDRINWPTRKDLWSGTILIDQQNIEEFWLVQQDQCPQENSDRSQEDHLLLKSL